VVRVLADTHAIIWYLNGSPSLSKQARAALDGAVHGRELCLSAITLVEMCYLVEKGSIPGTDLVRLEMLLRAPNGPLQSVPLDQDIAESLIHIPRTIVPDMPDRIIAATAHFLHIPVVTHDYRIRSSTVTSIW
jgi:PIN domain nuclease of toxin-antitoxin system